MTATNVQGGAAFVVSAEKQKCMQKNTTTIPLQATTTTAVPQSIAKKKKKKGPGVKFNSRSNDASTAMSLLPWESASPLLPSSPPSPLPTLTNPPVFDSIASDLSRDDIVANEKCITGVLHLSVDTSLDHHYHYWITDNGLLPKAEEHFRKKGFNIISFTPYANREHYNRCHSSSAPLRRDSLEPRNFRGMKEDNRKEVEEFRIIGVEIEGDEEVEERENVNEDRNASISAAGKLSAVKTGDEEMDSVSRGELTGVEFAEGVCRNGRDDLLVKTTTTTATPLQDTTTAIAAPIATASIDPSNSLFNFRVERRPHSQYTGPGKKRRLELPSKCTILLLSHDRNNKETTTMRAGEKGEHYHNSI